MYVYTYYFMISFLPNFHFAFVGLYADTLQSCYAKRRLGAHMAKQKERKNMTRHKSGSLTLFVFTAAAATLVRKKNWLFGYVFKVYYEWSEEE